jgi:hypothetical protein
MEKNQDPELEQRIQEANALPWIYVDDMGAGDILQIKTKDKIWEMKIIDPLNRKAVMIQGEARFVLRPLLATVIGSIIDPESEDRHYKVGGIAVGLPLILHLTGDDFYTLLEPTVEVYVNDQKVLPDLSKIKSGEE